jgi:hypothetical protein
MNRRHVFALILFMVSSVACASYANAQNRYRLRVQEFSERPSCAEEVETGNPAIGRLSFVSYLRTDNDCDAPPHERLTLRDDQPSDQPRQALPGFSERDPIENELSQLGAAGYSIAVARQHVLAILRENNACSSWYAQAEPGPAGKFASLHFEIDSNGEDGVVGEYSYFNVVYREPYVARAQQDVGAGSTITLNSHGAFFVSRAPTKLRVNADGPLISQLHRRLRVGIYFGDSLNAQVATLLHEYGHVVGLLPVDRGEAGSALLSTQNTEVVLDHCRKEIEASGNRAVVLPLSLVTFERISKPR